MVENSSETNDRSSTNSSAMPLAAGTLLQEFEIERLVGIGGFGIVYLANDTLLHRRVAIKEYMPTATAARFDGVTVSVRSQAHQEEFQIGKRSFINEARMLARFKHPSLLEVFRFWEQHGTAYMAMPYYEGITLKESIKINGPFKNEAQLRSVLDPLLDVLDYMHKDSVYHRDIAPDNIMLLANGRPVLLDLGAARTVAVEGGSALTVLVKPGYAPVEQYADDASIRQGPWTDIYALGAVAWFSVRGVAPPPSASRMLRDSMQALSDSGLTNFGKECLTGLDSAMRIRPEDRPQNITDFKSALGWGGSGTRSHLGYGIETTKPVQNESKASSTATIPVGPTEQVIRKTVSEPSPKTNPTQKAKLAKNKQAKPLPGEDLGIPSKINPPFDAYVTTDLPAEKKIEMAPPVYEDLGKTVVVAKKDPFSISTEPPATQNGMLPVIGTPSSEPDLNDGAAPTIAAVKPAKKRALQIFVTLGALALAAIAVAFLTNPENTNTRDVARKGAEAPTNPIAPVIEAQVPVATQAPEAATVPNKPTEALIDPKSPEAPTTKAVIDASAATPSLETPKINDTKPLAQPDSPKAETAKQPEVDPNAPAVVRLNIKPWGEVFINGKSRVVSPPNKSLALAPGEYTIEIRNTDNPSANFKVKLLSGDQLRLIHDFSTGKSSSSVVKAASGNDTNPNIKPVTKPNVQIPAQHSRPASGSGTY